MSSSSRLFSSDAIILNETITITDERARYINRTLRLRVGDRFTLFDGRGGEYGVVITAAMKGRVEVLADSYDARSVESPARTHLLQGVSRGERMDFVVQKATELGVSRITPVLTEHSVVRLDAARAARRTEHWLRVAQSACEQCGRTLIPEIDPPVVLDHWFDDESPTTEQRLLLDPAANRSLASADLSDQETTLLIGPEGGLAEAEVARALDTGFQPLSLGPRILRTETAAIAALTIIQARLGDL